MEENIALLIADLSGYTALTETHGSLTAADLIDKYLSIVKNALVGDCELKERTGDEVLIVSRSADFLLATAVGIMSSSANEEKFLQVHGGLHYGSILNRNNSYFGTAINVTSRIAAKATTGSFWCSEEFMQALTDNTIVKIEPIGKHSFKNIAEEKEMFEIRNESHVSFFIDPICRMMILNTDNAIRYHDKKDVFFCSPSCLNIYTGKS
jgi:adenylate cyclase